MAARQSAQDFEDMAKGELTKFKEWLSKEGKSIENNEDRRSPNRHLSKHVTLLVKQRIGTDDKLRWLLPLAKHEDGETLKKVSTIR